jgi:H+/gluconate symporter-like permease
MIPNPILYNDTTIMIGLVVSCLIVLAIVMIPKAIRHRKRVKQNESEKSAPDEEQELEMIVVPNERTELEQAMADYKNRFLVNVNIPTRSGKLVGIRKKYHSRISKIVKTIGDNEVTLFSYIDNILKHHFETFQDDISELYKKHSDDDYLTPKKK